MVVCAVRRSGAAVVEPVPFLLSVGHVAVAGKSSDTLSRSRSLLYFNFYDKVVSIPQRIPRPSPEQYFNL